MALYLLTIDQSPSGFDAKITWTTILGFASFILTVGGLLIKNLTDQRVMRQQVKDLKDADVASNKELRRWAEVCVRQQTLFDVLSGDLKEIERRQWEELKK